MKTKLYQGLETAPPGVYYDSREWRFASLSDEGLLPEGEWRSVPGLALLVVGPLLGGLFAVFLPFIGFFLFLKVLFDWVAMSTAPAIASFQRVLSPAFVPLRAFFARRKKS